MQSFSKMASRKASFRDRVAAKRFHGYSHNVRGCSNLDNEEMIMDRTLTDAYRDAILMLTERIRDKVVLDVGCGTGVISIFCARAGARKVYAVEASDIAVQAKEAVKANGFSKIIKVLFGRVEEVEINEEVDVIISQWMGHLLLCKSMLPGVIYARDRWLKKPGGFILPQHATLSMMPITNPQRYADSIKFWRNVYDIDMSAMLPLAKQCAFEKPCVESIPANGGLDSPFLLMFIDCSLVTVEDLEDVTTDFSYTSIRDGYLHGFALWFQVAFVVPGDLDEVAAILALDSASRGQVSSLPETKRMPGYLLLTTGPGQSPTHFQQTVLYIYDPIEVATKQRISGSISFSQTKENPGSLHIDLDYAIGAQRYVKKSVMR